ncbi:outer membrane protein assembly factor BamE [bacterium]|nr:outer membrane protein assembly factor BamE [bacterium]
MKSWIWLAPLFLAIGCASAPHRQAMQVEQGMNQEQVKAVAGEPLDRVFFGAQERWVYGSDKPDAPRKVVVFRGGKVVSLENEAPAEAGKPLNIAPVIPPTGPIPDLPCVDRNTFGSFAQGGGCNMYGCWPPGGYCNAFGCSAQGTCTNKKCPRKIETYRCVE